MIWLRSTTVAAVALLLSCGGGTKETKQDPVETSTETAVTQQALDESDCLGNLVPPTGYQQETAFVALDTPNARQVAQELAAGKLTNRICQGYRCVAVGSKVQPWKVHQDAIGVCAMAVIKSQDVEQFKKEPRERLTSDLSARSQALLASVKTKKGEPRIAIDNVRDVGVEGGPRAEWLIDRMKAALSKNGALIARIPPDWSGLGLPPRTDAVLRGRITRMHGQESILEVTWTLDLGHGEKGVDPISFPELIGPAVNPLTQMSELAGINPNISLRFDARPGGGLCNGQKTELRLESSQELHTRVVNLFGDGDQAMVIFASEDEIPAQETLSLGEFQVVKATKVPAERFLVMGAQSKAGLGALASVNAPCRLPSDMARQLANNRGIPEGAKKFTTSRGYRILEGEECREFEPQTMPEGWFESVPECF